MAEFRYKFDTIEVDNPSNWRELQIVYRRDPTMSSLSTEFTSVMDFTGTAYDALKTAYDSSPCTTIVVDIDWRCSRFNAYTDLFDGDIVIKDVTFDFCREIASAEIVVNAFFRDVEKNLTLQLDVAGEYDATFDYHWPVYDTTNPPTGAATTSGNDATAITVFQLFEEGMDIISDNNIGFISSLFQTNFVSQVIRVDITTAPAAGETIVLTLLDDWGITHVYSTEAVASAVTTYDNFEKTLQLGDGTKPSRIQSEIAIVARSTVGGPTERFDCTLYFEASIVSFTLGTGVGTAIIQTAYVDGEQQALYTNSGLIDLQNTGTLSQSFVRTPTEWGLFAGVHKYSIREFFELITTVYNLGISLDETAPGVFEFRVEKKEFYFDTAVSLTIRGIRNIKWELNSPEVFGKILIGKESDKEIDSSSDTQDPTGTDELLNFLEIDMDLTCIDVKDLRQDTEYYALFGNTEYADFEGTIDIDYQYLVMGLTVAVTLANAPFDFDYKFWDVAGATFTTNNYHSVRYQPFAQLLWHGYFLPAYTLPDDTFTKAFTVAGGFSYTEGGGALSVPEGSGYTPLIATFDHYISKSDFDSIVRNETIVINETTDPANDKNTFIVEVNHRVFDGFTQFTLLSKK